VKEVRLKGYGITPLLYDSANGETTETESRLVIAKGWQGLTRGMKEFFFSDGTIFIL
jgi:hypothetical protein